RQNVVNKSHESSPLAQARVAGKNSKVTKSRPFVQRSRLSIIDSDEDESGDHSSSTTFVSFAQPTPATAVHSPRPSPETRSITSQTGSHFSPATRSPVTDSNVFQITHRRVQRRCHDNRIPLVGFHLVEETIIYPPLVGVTLAKDGIPDGFNPGKDLATRFGNAQLKSHHRPDGKIPVSLQSTTDSELLEYLAKRERAHLAQFAEIKQSTSSSTFTTSTVSARLQSRARETAECIDADNNVTTFGTKTPTSSNPPALLSRFVPSQSSSLSNLAAKSTTTDISTGTKPVPSKIPTVNGQPDPWLNTAQEAAVLGFYGPLTRTTTGFSPHRLLCKRFQLAVPVPAAPSHPTSTQSTTRWDQQPGLSPTPAQHHRLRVAAESSAHDNTNASLDSHSVTLEKPTLALLKIIFT
ncbi:hypothetical protein IWQ62_006317, partial [Dispira parvispora]